MHCGKERLWYNLQNMNILWVENHKGFSRIAVKNFLTSHTVTVVPSLSAARACLSEVQYDLVMLDYDLDDGKGIELVQEIMNRPLRPALIAASSHFADIEQVIADVYDTLSKQKQVKAPANWRSDD